VHAFSRSLHATTLSRSLRATTLSRSLHATTLSRSLRATTGQGEAPNASVVSVVLIVKPQ